MADILRMPRMSDTMEEGNLIGWQMKVGDAIQPGDVLAEVETDKATMELESYQEGVLLHIEIEQGAVPVNGILAVIGEKGEDFKALLNEARKENLGSEKSEEKESIGSRSDTSSPTISTAVPESQPVITTTEAPIVSNNSNSASITDDGRLKASPLAKKLAKENNIDLGNVRGTGEGGRIIKKDIDFYLKNPAPKIIDRKTKKDLSINLSPPPSTVYGDQPVSQMRRVIAKRLGESKFTAPHFYLTVEIDMDAAMATRKAINAVAKTRVSFNDFVVKASSLALRAHPTINSSWLGDTIRTNENINIGVAVAVPEGLLVPVINNADQKTLAQINGEVKTLAKKAKAKKLQPKEMSGNTFTISNLGMFGIEEFTAIINPPDACILAVGSIFQKASVKNGEIVARNTMKVTLSCDHRVVDGVTGAKFLGTFKSILEHPISMIYQD